MEPSTRPSRRLGRFAVPLAALVVGLLLGQATAGGTATKTVVKRVAVPPRATTRLVDGVRRGWPHTEAGAVRAATAYDLVTGTPLMFDAAKRTAAIHAMADPEAEAELQRGFAHAASLVESGLNLPPDGAASLFTATRNLAAGYRVKEYSSENATIDIWTIGVGGLGALDPAVGWGTSTVQLHWVDGDWRLVTKESNPGPTPPLLPDLVVTPATELIQRIDSFKEYPVVP